MSEWKLYLGDCIEGMRELPDKSVDHVITDPPFSPGMYERIRGNGGFFGGMPGTCTIGAATPELIAGASEGIARLARRWVLVFSDVELAPDWREALKAVGLHYMRTGLWIRRGAPQITGDRPAHCFEAITICHARGGSVDYRGGPRARWNGGGKWAVWETDINREPDRFHPTQKPLDLMQQLVRDFTDGEELVCDPFSGAGTTGVACVRLRRRFIGWELNPTFHAAATKRLSAARQQYELLPRPSKPKQQGLGFTSVEAPQAPLSGVRRPDPEAA